MPVATFTANFASFYDAVDKAEAKLKDFGMGADKAGARLNVLAEQFSGKRIVQEATMMAKAVEEIGGVSVLTEKELKRLGATTNEAVEKMKALGMDVPKNLQAIADQTKHANDKTIDWKSSLVSLAGAMGIAFSVDAVVGFAKSIVSLASNIKDLSNQWGVSIQDVQQFSGAAEASGVAASTVGKALQYMGNELAGTDPLYDDLIQNLKLSKAGLAEMGRAEAFRAIVDGLMGITNENDRLAYGLKLLGPAWREMGGAAADGLVEASRHQKAFTDDTVKRLADAEAAWKKLYNSIVIFSGEAMATAMANTETLTSSWRNFFGFIAAEIKKPGAGGGMFLEQQRAAKALEAQLKTTTTTIGTTGKATGKLGGEFLSLAMVEDNLKKKTDALKAAEEARTKALAEAKAKQEAFRKEVEAQQKAIVDLSRSLSGDGLIQQAIKYLSALETSIPIQKMTAKAQAEINAVMANAIDVYVEAGDEIPKVMLDTWVATKIANDRIVDFNFSLEELKKRYLDLSQLPKFDPFTVTGNQNVDLGQAPAEDRTPYVIKNVMTLSQELGKLGAIAGGAFGEVAMGAADVGWAFDQATVAAGNMQKGFDSIKAGKTAEGMTTVASSALQAAGAFMAATEGASMAQSILTGGAMGAALAPGPYMAYAAAAGMAVGALRGFMNAQAAADAVDDLRAMMLQSVPNIGEFRAQVEAAGYDLASFEGADSIEQVKFRWQELVDAVNANEIREAFIETAGGVEELRRAAELAGVDITKMLDQSTAGKALQAEIDTLTEAFKFQDESMATLIETAERYGFTLAELGPAMQAQELDKQAQGLFKDWQVLNAAGIETVDITKRMGDSVSDYVNQALAMGFEVPAAMRPMLEAMVEAGELTDANGEAIKDLEGSGVSFAMTMSDGFKRLIDVVKELTDSISRSLGIAIKNVPDVKVKGSVEWDVGDPSKSQQGAGLEGFARGTDGFRDFGTGTPVMLHGVEAVIPRDQASSAVVAGGSLASTTAAAAPPIIINAQGAFFDTPDSLQRLATKVSDALTAKYSVMGKLRAAV